MELNYSGMNKGVDKMKDDILIILSIIAGTMFFTMMILFIVSCIKLSHYSDCRDIDFQTEYCEKYKNY